MSGMGSHQSHRAGTTTWLTPPHILAALGPFDLDPCAAPGWPTASRHITLPDDGLAADWSGRVWLNPPYGNGAWEWLAKLAAHGSGIALIFARTETEGFVREVWGKADAVMFLHGRLHFHRSLPVPAGHSVLTRTDATVDALSRYVLDAALDSRLDPAARPARRAGVLRTSGVTKVTILLMVRHRLEITIPGSAGTVTQVAEEAKFLAFTASGDTLTWLPQGEVDALLSLMPSGNVDDALARTQLGRALGRLEALSKHLTTTGKDAAKDLVSEHQAVRSASKAAGRAPTVRFLPPADVLGIYVFLPEAGAR